MERELIKAEISDDALMAACRVVQETTFPRAAPALAECWRAIELGFAAHVARHERYTASRLARRDVETAARVRRDHLALSAKLQRCGVDLRQDESGAALSAKLALDGVIEHLLRDADCKFVASPRRRRTV
jgi:hypothetical protein